MANITEVNAAWPPPPSTSDAPSVPHATPESFTVDGVALTATDDRIVVDNPKARAASILFWIWQASVMGGTLWIQYQSMLWFQNVWGFRGAAVVLQVAMQAVVWIGMTAAYVLFDWANYNFQCRFRATFDHSVDEYVEGKNVFGSLGRIISIEVRKRTSFFFFHRYEVRLLLTKAKAGVEIDHRSVQERLLATFAKEADAQKLAGAVAGFIGAGVRQTG